MRFYYIIRCYFMSFVWISSKFSLRTNFSSPTTHILKWPTPLRKPLNSSFVAFYMIKNVWDRLLEVRCAFSYRDLHILDKTGFFTCRQHISLVFFTKYLG
eukprot:UN00192